MRRAARRSRVGRDGDPYRCAMTHAYAGRSIAELYTWFAAEAAATSPTWEAVCTWVAASPAVTARLDTLPGMKRQPNLFLGALKYLGAPLAPGPRLAAWIDDHWDDVAALIGRRATQTNEPGRCAVLAPVLASLPQPVALLEVGASAGLCRVPDRYRYRYTGEHPAEVAGSDAAADAPLLECRVDGTPPASPDALVIAARVGLDRSPLHADDPDDVRWLRAVVWPGEDEREGRLAEALESLGRRPPTILSGDALADLDALLALVPEGATPVVMHSATLAYLGAAEREEFVRRVAASGAHWLSFEGVGVLAGIRERLPDVADHRDEPFFVVALDGEPLGRCSPHGGWVSWFDR